MGSHQTSHLRPEAITDLESCTSFSADEIREFYKDFRGKTSGHLSLSKDEFVEAYAKLFPKGDAKKFAEQVFRMYDRDESGSIGQSQFKCCNF